MGSVWGTGAGKDINSDSSGLGIRVPSWEPQTVFLRSQPVRFKAKIIKTTQIKDAMRNFIGIT
jgi:hypothetical protein